MVVAEGAYRDELISKIVFMCSRDKFAYLTDFAWYLSVLVDLATIQGTAHGSLVRALPALPPSAARPRRTACAPRAQRFIAG